MSVSHPIASTFSNAYNDAKVAVSNRAEDVASVDVTPTSCTVASPLARMQLKRTRRLIFSLSSAMGYSMMDNAVPFGYKYRLTSSSGQLDAEWSKRLQVKAKLLVPQLPFLLPEPAPNLNLDERGSGGESPNSDSSYVQQRQPHRSAHRIRHRSTAIANSAPPPPSIAILLDLVTGSVKNGSRMLGGGFEARDGTLRVLDCRIGVAPGCAKWTILRS
ncbi:hypothetical protein F5887DRAFT_1161815 [Amanita rubescens]|nr:hypothetical protein F5887DRAFT_1161815 [Amanita rubescens]